MTLRFYLLNVFNTEKPHPIRLIKSKDFKRGYNVLNTYGTIERFDNLEKEVIEDNDIEVLSYIDANLDVKLDKKILESEVDAMMWAFGAMYLFINYRG